MHKSQREITQFQIILEGQKRFSGCFYFFRKKENFFHFFSAHRPHPAFFSFFTRKKIRETLFLETFFIFQKVAIASAFLYFSGPYEGFRSFLDDWQLGFGLFSLSFQIGRMQLIPIDFEIQLSLLLSLMFCMIFWWKKLPSFRGLFAGSLLLLFAVVDFQRTRIEGFLLYNASCMCFISWFGFKRYFFDHCWQLLIFF